MMLPAQIVVIGTGRVGSAIVSAATAQGVPVATCGRGAPIPAVPTGTPLVVCTRADALEEVVARTPVSQRADLVFVQNGMIVPFLARHGLARATQGVLYFAATSRTAPAAPGGVSPFFGPHAAAMVALLEGAGLPARVVPDWAEFAAEIGMKLAWNAIFGLLGDRWDERVGETVANRPTEIATLAAELAPVLADGLGAPIPAAPLRERIVAYALRIPDFRAEVKELAWRNGWLAAHARAAGIPTPLHSALLAAIGVPSAG